MVDGSELTSQIGVDEDEIRWRKEYTQFSEDDARELGQVSHLFEDIADDLIEEFYDRLQSYNRLRVDSLGMNWLSTVRTSNKNTLLTVRLVLNQYRPN